MSSIVAKHLSQKLCVSAWRTFSSKAENAPYWRTKFPDRIASFDEIPTTTNDTDFTGSEPDKYLEVAEEMYKKHGYVVKEPLQDGEKTFWEVHLFHVEDFRTVYNNEREFMDRPLIHSQWTKATPAVYGHSWQRLDEHSCRLLETADRKTFGSKRMFEEVGNDLVQIIRANVIGRNGVDLLPWLGCWTLESTGVFALNQRLNSLLEAGRMLPKIWLNAITRELLIAIMNPLVPYVFFENDLLHSSFSDILRYLIADTKEIQMGLENESLTQFLRRQKEYNEEDAIKILINLFHGSLQTVPFVLLMALFNIARNKNVQVQAREELIKYLPTASTKYYSTKFPETFNLMKSIVWETLRLQSPIICSGRLTNEEMVLGGYRIPKNTTVILHFQLACHLEEFYKDPLAFNPERFKEEKSFESLSNHIFGYSWSECVGSAFAMDQMIFILSKLLRNFEFSYGGEERPMINRLHYNLEWPLHLKVNNLPQ